MGPTSTISPVPTLHISWNFGLAVHLSAAFPPDFAMQLARSWESMLEILVTLIGVQWQMHTSTILVAPAFTISCTGHSACAKTQLPSLIGAKLIRSTTMARKFLLSII